MAKREAEPQTPRSAQIKEGLRAEGEPYRLLFEKNPRPMWVYDLQSLAFLAVNEAAVAQYGYSRAEMLHMTIPDIYPAEDIPLLLQSISRHTARLEKAGVWRHRKKDGVLFDVEIVSNDVDWAGRPARLVLAEDITERKRAEKALRDSESNLLAAQAIAHVGNWSWDIVNDVVAWSPELFAIFGVSRASFNFKVAAVAKLIHPDDVWRHEKCIADMFAGKPFEPFEYRVVRPDSSERVVQVLGGVLERDLTGRPHRMSGVVLDVTERRGAEERFYKAFNACPEPITIATMSEGRYLDVNESFLRVTGYRREEVIGRTSLHLKFWERPEDRATLIEVLRKHGSVRDMEITFHTKSGEQRTGLDSADVIEIAGQKCIIAFFKDITERKFLEEQLRLAQKMEAVGRLSGGIAHDFNNLLGVIIGYSELLEERLPQTDRLHNMSQQITKAAQSAASLTRQLLAFSRQQVLEPKILDLNAVILDLQQMLRRLIGEDIDLGTALGPALGHVKADQGQIQQVILNLVVNARDAMPDGGKLTLETANVDLDEDYARRHPPVLAGSYVLLAVTDTGVGIDAETQSHVFEPFFTTKAIGKGTGLGLATVYGVVKQSGGYIWVYSEPGQGTTFKVYLPRSGEAACREEAVAGSMASLRGTETILLVEDEEALRDLTRSLLVDSGYTVLEAKAPAQAIEIVRNYRESIDLLLSDVVMPGMSGPDLAKHLAQLRPYMKVCYMSGYTGHSALRRGLLDSHSNVLQKPFTREKLLRYVRETFELERAPKSS
jgi:two-component system, cell cycle sensor histidine kinase and response regulator CckA